MQYELTIPYFALTFNVSNQGTGKIETKSENGKMEIIQCFFLIYLLLITCVADGVRLLAGKYNCLTCNFPQRIYTLSNF